MNANEPVGLLRVWAQSSLSHQPYILRWRTFYGADQ